MNTDNDTPHERMQAAVLAWALAALGPERKDTPATTTEGGLILLRVEIVTPAEQPKKAA